MNNETCPVCNEPVPSHLSRCPNRPMNPPAPAMPDERRWFCSFCGSTYAEYCNGCPRCHLGEPGTATSLRCVVVVPAAELTTLRQRLAEAEKELAGVLDLIPKDHIVRVREGGGPEDVAATVAVSVGRVVHKLAKAEAATLSIRNAMTAENLRVAADAARWEGAARIMGKYIRATDRVENGHGAESIHQRILASNELHANPTASALVREGGGGE